MNPTRPADLRTALRPDADAGLIHLEQTGAAARSEARAIAATSSWLCS
ncbi:MAG: hypothetical protein QG671_992 [Actinomycetota bacterium]|nr:hypothetical protein [Actinomycetota bacterium]